MSRSGSLRDQVFDRSDLGEEFPDAHQQRQIVASQDAASAVEPIQAPEFNAVNGAARIREEPELFTRPAGRNLVAEESLALIAEGSCLHVIKGERVLIECPMILVAVLVAALVSVPYGPKARQAGFQAGVNLFLACGVALRPPPDWAGTA